MSQFSISPRRFLITFAAVSTVFGAIHFSSAIEFVLKPSDFYFRAWEYVSDVIYRTQIYGNEWRGEEGFDLGRRYFFNFQDHRFTHVSVDRYGYRVTPAFDAPYAAIAVVGDSEAWGSALSDGETIPWQLSKLTSRSVLNLSRFHLCRALQHPRVQRRTLIVEILTERNIRGRVFPYKCKSSKPLASLRRPAGYIGLIRAIDAKRYSPLLRLPSVLQRATRDLSVAFSKPKMRYLFLNHRMSPNNLTDAVRSIVKRHHDLSLKGIDYLFVPMPAKQTIYGKNIDSYTKNYLPRLYRALSEAGVPYVDVSTPFRTNRDKGLFFPYDTHVNPRGAQIVAIAIARFLKQSQTHLTP